MKEVDPRDRFSIPNNELRQEKYHRLKKAEAAKERAKVEKEAE